MTRTITAIVVGFLIGICVMHSTLDWLGSLNRIDGGYVILAGMIAGAAMVLGIAGYLAMTEVGGES